MTAVEQLKALLANYILWATAISWCISQFTKMFIFLFTHKHNSFWKAIETAFWSTGGMPSAHSAVVCCLTVSVGIHEGLNSSIFAVAVFFAMVVLRDSMGVRMATGLQAKALNELGKMTVEKTGIEFKPVKEIPGHTPLEVVVGGILGIVVAICFSLLL